MFTIQGRDNDPREIDRTPEIRQFCAAFHEGRPFARCAFARAFNRPGLNYWFPAPLGPCSLRDQNFSCPIFPRQGATLYKHSHDI